jgi:CO/xanthine dehydrogenase FAD-binding subunit
LQAFDYLRADSIPEVLSLLEKEGENARILSGGTDLLVQLREGRLAANLLVDIKSIPEVNAISFTPGEGLFIGAAVSCARICRDPLVTRHYPGLVDAVSLIGGTQIQGRASLGGNLCNASPAADSIPALIVHSAVCEIASPAGFRFLPAEHFCTAPGQTVLLSSEFLIGFRIMTPPQHFGAAYLRFTPRNEMDIGVVGAGASLVLDEEKTAILSARLALGAVAPTPLLVQDAGEFLSGKDISTAVIDQAASLAQSAVKPIDDMRGTVTQRKHLAAVLSRRVLGLALSRAGGQHG